jgi:hypothetical protein
MIRMTRSLLRRGMVPLLAVLAMLVFASTAAAGSRTWTLASDFRTAPNEANPNPDSYGNSDVWAFRQGPSSIDPFGTRDPAQYQDLGPTYGNVCSADTEAWFSSEFYPFVGKTTADHGTCGTGNWMAGEVAVHPSSSRLAVVEWRSPLSGTVSIGGGVTDWDANGGDGVRWVLDTGPASRTINETLASGSIENGGEQSFAAGTNTGVDLASISVQQGDIVYFVIDAGVTGEQNFDTTGLSVTITEQDTNLPATVNVPGQANIFGAGHGVPPSGDGGEGSLPPGVSLAAGTGRVLTVSNVTGTVNSGCTGSANGPDGLHGGCGGTDINSTGGIAGIVDSQASMMLVGVFLTDSEPQDPAPARLDFSPSVGLGEDYAAIAPGIGQVFYVGDGLTGTGSGSAQQIQVPPNATRLFLGIADAFVGDPGHYGDNSGNFTATVDVTADEASPSLAVQKLDTDIPVVPPSPGPNPLLHTSSPTFSGTASTAAGSSATVTVHLDKWTGSNWITDYRTFTTTRDASTGAWSASPPGGLLNDTYSLYVTQNDGTQDQTSGAWWFHTDATPPAVTVTGPANNSLTNFTRPPLSGAAGTRSQDNTYVSVSLKRWTGSEWVSVQNWSSIGVVSGKWKINADAVPVLDPGTYEVNVQQADTAGNLGSASARFRVDISTPTITIDSPAQGHVYDAGTPISVSYHCDDPDNASSDVACTGEAPLGTIASGGSFQMSDAGSFTFKVTATDPAGNTATKNVTFGVQVPSSTGGGGGGRHVLSVDSPTNQYAVLCGRGVYAQDCQPVAIDNPFVSYDTDVLQFLTNMCGTTDFVDKTGRLCQKTVTNQSAAAQAGALSGALGLGPARPGTFARITESGRELATQRLDGNVIAVGGGNVIAVGGGNVIAVGGGNLVSVDGGKVIAVGGGNVIAVGGGNLVKNAAGQVIAVGGGNWVERDPSGRTVASGNVIAVGGGNVIAVGGGNVIAVGGGNVIAVGGGNVIAVGGGNFRAAAARASAANGPGISSVSTTFLTLQSGRARASLTIASPRRDGAAAGYAAAARRKKAKPVVLARADATYARPGLHALIIRFTPKGMKLLSRLGRRNRKHPLSVNLTLTDRFVPKKGKSVVVTRRFKVTPGKAKRR